MTERTYTPAEWAMIVKYEIDLRHFDVRGMELIELQPDSCPDGHPLLPGKSLVGRIACSCTPLMGHRYWSCACGATACWPGCSERPAWKRWNGVPTVDAPGHLGS